MKPYEPKIDLFRYDGPGGSEILAGRTDRDNDLLSLKLARPNDYWFHVKGQPGSHVVLQCEGEPDREQLRAAASVAAWHSKMRKAGTVPVSCQATDSAGLPGPKNVSKPRGARPGTVQIRNEKTLKVRPALPGDA